MAAPFAALESRLNTAVLSRLSNAAVTVDGAEVNGIFDNGYDLATVGLSGMASTQPTFTLSTSSVPASPVGTPVVVNGTNYLVAAHEPDGTGISRLILERA